MSWAALLAATSLIVTPVNASASDGDGSLRIAADTATNLITVLNQAALVPAGGKIVQARYTSDNPAVVPNFDRFVPKGDFTGNGTAGVKLQQLKVYRNGVTSTVNTTQNIQVTVTNLPARVDVVDYLKSMTGRGMTSAMYHDQSYADPLNSDSLHQRVANEFGVYPALYSADFLTGGTVPNRQNMINEVKRQWNNGNLVQIMFHVSPPQYTVAQERDGGWGGDQAQETLPSPNRIFSFLYNNQWRDLMTNGTALNANWKRRMDEYARYLQQLEDAGVTVMLRPFHEMQQHVFWWGGRPGLGGSAGLYRMFHDYMQNVKGLSNIIWVWDVQDLPDNYGWANGDPKFDRYEGLAGGLAEYNANDWTSFSPGRGYYDVLAVDFYDAEGYSPRRYQQATMIAQRDDKPMIIGETFVFPTRPQLASQPNWSLTMPWGVRTWNNNTKAAMATFYANSVATTGMPRFSTRRNPVTPPIGP
jgi:glycosyl hydrolase family 26